MLAFVHTSIYAYALQVLRVMLMYARTDLQCLSATSSQDIINDSIYSLISEHPVANVYIFFIDKQFIDTCTKIKKFRANNDDLKYYCTLVSADSVTILVQQLSKYTQYTLAYPNAQIISETNTLTSNKQKNHFNNSSLSMCNLTSMSLNLTIFSG